MYASSHPRRHREEAGDQAEGGMSMEKPENLRQLIEAIESESKRKSLSDEWLEEHGYSTREDMGSGEYAYGIVRVPED